MKIIDDEEYEKNKTFTVMLEEPILLEVGQRHGECGTNATAVTLNIIVFWLEVNLLCILSPSYFI